MILRGILRINHYTSPSNFNILRRSHFAISTCTTNRSLYWKSPRLYGITVNKICRHPCQEYVRKFLSAVPPTEGGISSISEADFEVICEDTLDALAVKFEDLAEEGLTDSEFDVEFSGGVLTVKLGSDKGTFVINKQTPNRQIWLSSPFSGPKRYDCINERWIYKRDGVSLHQLLSQEITHVLGTPVDFTQCSHGGEP